MAFKLRVESTFDLPTRGLVVAVTVLAGHVYIGDHAVLPLKRGEALVRVVGIAMPNPMPRTNVVDLLVRPLDSERIEGDVPIGGVMIGVGGKPNAATKGGDACA